MTTRRAVVTGASSGIGRATVVALRDAGWDVIGVARRADRLAELAAETGAQVFAADLTQQADVDALVEYAASLGSVHSLVQVAGGAAGTERIEDGRPEDWEWMFQANIMSTQRLIAGFLPMLRQASADSHADIVVVTSTAAQSAYVGGAGYNAAKAGESMIVNALRLELAGEPIRVIEVAPGLVHTEEFSLNRLRGNTAAADSVYEGVVAPLVASDVADVIRYALVAPGHVNLDLITMRPVAQSANTVLTRVELRPKLG